MMNDTVDLYGHFGLEKPDGAVGELDCLIPSIPPELASGRNIPAVLILPGGGYHHTSAREGEPVALRFAARGFAAFVLRYSCAPCRFPVALREVAMAMRFIREHAGEWHIGGNMVAAMGFSAGGHLCGTLGTLFDSPEVADIGAAELLRPDALGLCYPVTVSHGKCHGGSFHNLCGENGQLRERLSLERLVRRDMPPVFLWHTREDESVPCWGSLVFARALEEADVPFAMHIYRHGRHGLATADHTGLRIRDAAQVGRDVPGWIDECIGFFREAGLDTIDIEDCL